MRWFRSGRNAIALGLAAVAAGGGFIVLSGGLQPDESVDGYVKRMSSYWPETRRQAATELGRLTDQPDEAVPVLVSALDDADVDVRSNALDSLGQFRDVAAPSAGKAAEILAHDARPELRRRAARLLGETQDPASIPALMSALKDGDLGVRVEAVTSLGRFGRRGSEATTLPVAPAAIVDALLGGIAPEQFDEMRSAAVDALDSFSGGEERIAQALAAAGTKDANPQIRRKALGLLRQEYPATIAALVAGVDDPDPQVMLEATTKLARIGLADERVLPALHHAVVQADERVREGVGMALDNLVVMLPPPALAPDALAARYEAAVRELSGALEDRAAAGRPQMLNALSKIAGVYEKTSDPSILPAASSAIDAVFARLDDPDEDGPLRMHAASQWDIARTFVNYHRVKEKAQGEDPLKWVPRWIEAMANRLQETSPQMRLKAVMILRDAREFDDAPGVRDAWDAVRPKLAAASNSDDLVVRAQVVELLNAENATPPAGSRSPAEEKTRGAKGGPERLKE